MSKRNKMAPTEVAEIIKFIKKHFPHESQHKDMAPMFHKNARHNKMPYNLLISCLNSLQKCCLCWQNMEMLSYVTTRTRLVVV